MFNYIEVTSKDIRVTVKESYAEQNNLKNDYEIIKWNVKPGIHEWIEEDIPLELLWLASIDFLEDISFGYKVILYYKNPYGLEDLLNIGMYRLFLPFHVRAANKNIFPNVFQMIPIESNILAPLETVTEQNEDYIRNALATFASITDKEERYDQLESIIFTELDKIEERFRIFSRIVVPVVHNVAIRKHLEHNIIIKRKEQQGQYEFSYKPSIKIDAKEIAEKIQKNLQD